MRGYIGVVDQTPRVIRFRQVPDEFPLRMSSL